MSEYQTGLTKGEPGYRPHPSCSREATGGSETQPLQHLPLLKDISSPEIDWSACEDLLREPLFPGLEVTIPALRLDVFQTLRPNSWDFEELIPWANPTEWESLEYRARYAVDSGAGAVRPGHMRPTSGCPPRRHLRAALQGKQQTRQQAAVPPLRHEGLPDGITCGCPCGSRGYWSGRHYGGRRGLNSLK